MSSNPVAMRMFAAQRIDHPEESKALGEGIAEIRRLEELLGEIGPRREGDSRRLRQLLLDTMIRCLHYQERGERDFTKPFKPEAERAELNTRYLNDVRFHAQVERAVMACFSALDDCRWAGAILRIAEHRCNHPEGHLFECGRACTWCGEPQPWRINVVENDREVWIQLYGPHGEAAAFPCDRTTVRGEVLHQFALAIERRRVEPLGHYPPGEGR